MKDVTFQKEIWNNIKKIYIVLTLTILTLKLISPEFPTTAKQQIGLRSMSSCKRKDRSFFSTSIPISCLSQYRNDGCFNNSIGVIYSSSKIKDLEALLLFNIAPDK